MSGVKDNQIIIEFISMGRHVKVTAIDPISLREVSIVGDARASQHSLKELAVQKLRYVLEKEDT